ncbi:PLP-dependent aminotransferase family protein [Lacticaseibacillus kribbianus]|uniref:aminotransferase-like domain-containing protein n=1 Tax=Lacticaseibacillus kribbianus TaxID=2926292 RepID=UPI001CD3E5EE|nr:PLP-dependent aminotransferase family protein [Lacticaseibacillus kribbianus]
MLRLDETLAAPLHRQLYLQLRAEIETGVRSAGQKLPSTRFLARQLGVSRNTVDHAYQDLVAEGYLVARAGAAHRVTATLPLAVPAASALPRRERAFAFDFTEGYDELRLFPAQAWQAATQRVLARGIAHIQPAAGDPSYRQQLVHLLARLHGVACDPSQVVVTAGFTEAAAIIAHLVPALAQRGLAVPEPVAPNAREVWATLGVPVVPVRDLAQVAGGLVGAGGAALARGEGTAAAAAAGGLLLAPTHNFPDGAGLDAVTRRAVAARLAANDQVLIELDTDGTLTYDGQAAPALHQALGGRNAFYYMNFDETLGSSLCAGVLVIPAALVPRFAAIYGKLPNRNSQLQQQVLSQLIANDALERYLRQLTIVYANRRRLLVDTVAAAFGPAVTPLGTAAGSFVPLALRTRVPVAELIARAAAAGVGLVDPDRCWHDLRPAYPSVVLSFRQTDDAAITGGIAAMAVAWQHLLV